MNDLLLAGDLHEIVDAFSTTLDAKSTYTCGHSERVAEIALAIAKVLGLTESEQMRIHIGAHLHDIGKIGIPDSILNKPGKLTDIEYETMKTHPTIGYHIVSKIRVLKPMADIVWHHHERMDGKGYPDGLKGDKISLASRIVAIADTFDAMTSQRAYREKLSMDEAIAELKRHRGTQFDAAIIDVVIDKKILEKFDS
jgi:putative nucleotidyltransferase with HDIG domain